MMTTIENAELKTQFNTLEKSIEKLQEGIAKIDGRTKTDFNSLVEGSKVDKTKLDESKCEYASTKTKKTGKSIGNCLEALITDDGMSLNISAKDGSAATPIDITSKVATSVTESFSAIETLKESELSKEKLEYIQTLCKSGLRLTEVLQEKFNVYTKDEWDKLTKDKTSSQWETSLTTCIDKFVKEKESLDKKVSESTENEETAKKLKSVVETVTKELGDCDEKDVIPKIQDLASKIMYKKELEELNKVCGMTKSDESLSAITRLLNGLNSNSNTELSKCLSDKDSSSYLSKLTDKQAGFSKLVLASSILFTLALSVSSSVFGVMYYYSSSKDSKPGKKVSCKK